MDKGTPYHAVCVDKYKLQFSERQVKMAVGWNLSSHYKYHGVKESFEVDYMASILHDKGIASDCECGVSVKIWGSSSVDTFKLKVLYRSS